MPYLRQINTTATRTLLFLENNGTLRPLAIELSLPSDEDQLGAVSMVYAPAHEGAASTIWQLAKAYVAVYDFGYHQLICHCGRCPVGCRRRCEMLERRAENRVEP
ncbi:hypothetical protein LguiB_021021 [Lonicera macranthoides]